MNFLIRHCVDGTSSTLTPSSFALRSLLIGSNKANREIIHEWVRQAMLMPYVWSDVTRGSLGVMRVWCSLTVRICFERLCAGTLIDQMRYKLRMMNDLFSFNSQ